MSSQIQIGQPRDLWGRLITPPLQRSPGFAPVTITNDSTNAETKEKSSFSENLKLANAETPQAQSQSAFVNGPQYGAANPTQNAAIAPPLVMAMQTPTTTTDNAVARPPDLQKIASLDSKPIEWFGSDGANMKDALDVINPLQSLPVIGTTYRQATGEEISPVSQILGGALYGALGGPIGIAIGLGSALANIFVKQQTGDDIEGYVLTALGIKAKDNPNDKLAEAKPNVVASLAHPQRPQNPPDGEAAPLGGSIKTGEELAKINIESDIALDAQNLVAQLQPLLPTTPPPPPQEKMAENGYLTQSEVAYLRQLADQTARPTASIKSTIPQSTLFRLSEHTPSDDQLKLEQNQNIEQYRLQQSILPMPQGKDTIWTSIDFKS